MCEVATALAVGGLVVGVASDVIEGKAQDKAAEANRLEAERALKETNRALSLRALEEQGATSLTIAQAERQLRSSQSSARVAAGEAGVAGASVEALLNDLQLDLTDLKTTEQRNLSATLDQIEAERRGADALARSRIAAVPRSNPLYTGLRIGARAIDTADTLYSRRPQPSGS